MVDSTIDRDDDDEQEEEEWARLCFRLCLYSKNKMINSSLGSFVIKLVA